MVLDCYNFMRARVWPANRLAQPADTSLSPGTKRACRLASSKIGQRLALFVPLPARDMDPFILTLASSARATLVLTIAEQ